MAFYKHSRHCELHPLERWQKSLEIQRSTNASSLTEKCGKFLVIFINLSPVYQTWYLEIHPYFNTDLIAYIYILGHLQGAFVQRALQ